MKAILTALLFSVPVLGFGQVQETIPSQPTIDLKMEQVSKERAKARDKAETHLLIGAALSTLGTGIGLLGPMFTHEPAEPTPAYLNEVRLAGNNAERVKELSAQYQKDLVAYSDNMNRYELKSDTYRLVGVGVFALGQGFNIGGIIKLVRNSN